MPGVPGRVSRPKVFLLLFLQKKKTLITPRSNTAKVKMHILKQHRRQTRLITNHAIGPAR